MGESTAKLWRLIGESLIKDGGEEVFRTLRVSHFQPDGPVASLNNDAESKEEATLMLERDRP